MRIEDYKAYMERVETTAEMDERVLTNLKNSVTGESISNKNFQQQTMQHKQAFFYRASVVAVCFLVMLVIGKFYTGIKPSDENSNAQKDVQPASTNTETEIETPYLRTPHFSNLYGQEIGSHAIQRNYIDEDNHIRICIQEMISDECITEILGYFEAKDEMGKEWLKERTPDFNFTVSIQPTITTYDNKAKRQTMRNLSKYYTFQAGDHQTERLKSYNTSKRTYFDRYFITSPDFQTSDFFLSYKLYNIYNETEIAITEQMESKTYPLENGKKSKGKHYQPSEVILSPLGGLMIKGKDLGIKAASEKTADNFSTLQLELQSGKHIQTIPLVENEVWTGLTAGLEDCGIWFANILSEQHKKDLGMEYSLLTCRLSPDIDTSRISSIQIDDASYPLKNSSDKDTTDN